MNNIKVRICKLADTMINMLIYIYLKLYFALPMDYIYKEKQFKIYMNFTMKFRFPKENNKKSPESDYSPITPA